MPRQRHPGGLQSANKDNTSQPYQSDIGSSLVVPDAEPTADLFK